MIPGNQPHSSHHVQSYHYCAQQVVQGNNWLSHMVHSLYQLEADDEAPNQTFSSPSLVVGWVLCVKVERGGGMTWMGLFVVNVVIQLVPVGVIFQICPVAWVQEGLFGFCSTLQTTF